MSKDKELSTFDNPKLSNSERYPIVVGKSHPHWLGMSGVVLKPHRPSKHKQRAGLKRK